MRDDQRQKFYNWEDENIPSGRHLSFNEIESYVHDVWEELGLQYPPLIYMFHKNVTTKAGTGSRTSLSFPEKGATEHTILHEIAHALTSTVNGDSNSHNSVFVGVFMHLIEKFMNEPLFKMWYTAEKAKIKYEKFPQYLINNVR